LDLSLLFLAFSIGLVDLFDMFFKFAAGSHDFVTAAAASKLEIRSGPQHFPLIASAGVGFFHG
jgi:hypothetical protein